MEKLDGKQYEETLEGLVDQEGGVRYLLEMLSDVCLEKAAHIESNWQDLRTAATWEKAAEVIERVSNNQDIKAIS